MIDVHQNAALSESFEGDGSRVIGNRCNYFVVLSFAITVRPMIHMNNCV